MQFKDSFNFAEILNRGFRSFKSTFRPFFKYALLAVFVSYLIQLYVTVLDTYLLDHEMIYVAGIVLLVLLFLPIAYLTIRLNMTAAGKLKAIIEGQPFNFKNKFTESKHDFWRVFAVLAVKFIIKLTMYLSLVPLGLYLVSELSPMQPALNTNMIWLILPSSAVALVMLYILTRLEFATLVIYWHVDTDKSDLSTSMFMTKKQYFSKLMLIIVAHIPGFILSMITFMNFLSNYQSVNLFTRWFYLGTVILISTISFAWPMCLYYPMFKDMKAFPLASDRVIDEDGKEWLTF